MSKRIDYIDVIKGLTIFGVVWVHTICPQWLTALLVNFIFFFLSGFFFKRKPLKTFFREKVGTLLIPFSFFYLISNHLGFAPRRLGNLRGWVAVILTGDQIKADQRSNAVNSQCDGVAG